MVKVTENWAATLRAMKVENADWKRTGEVDRKRGEFKIQRVS